MNIDNVWFRNFGFRLIKLAEKLESLAPSQFDFDTWVGNNWCASFEENISCNTSACSLGWASTLPEFKSMNFKFGRLNKFVIDNKIYSIINFKLALAPRLGLTASEFEHLFYPNSELCYLKGLRCSATAFEAAAHIRNFVFYKIRESMPVTIPTIVIPNISK